MTNGKPKVSRRRRGQEALGTTQRTSGTQVTYDGHPLYLFVGDKKAGQTSGEGSTAFGAPWYVMRHERPRDRQGLTAPGPAPGRR